NVCLIENSTSNSSRSNRFRNGQAFAEKRLKDTEFSVTSSFAPSGEQVILRGNPSSPTTTTILTQNHVTKLSGDKPGASPPPHRHRTGKFSPIPGYQHVFCNRGVGRINNKHGSTW